MRKLLLTFLLSTLSLVASAYDACVDGIYYNFSGTEATVTWVDADYSGSVTIPSSVTYSGTTYSVTSIGGSAFRECTSLTSITIPSSVTSIGNFAFEDCKGLKSITIPSSVTSIGYYAFRGCYMALQNLKNESSFDLSNYELTICDTEQADGLLIKDNSAVFCRKWATVVTIPSGVTSFGFQAFCDCYGLTSISIPSSVTSIGEYAFECCSGLTSITIPSSVTSIGTSAFVSCTGLTSITIPSSVTSIGYAAFACCSGLTSIIIPSSVISIGNRAFHGCNDLDDVYCYIKEPVSISSNNTFSKYGNLHVLPGCGYVYRAAEYWKKFTIIEDLETGVEDAPFTATQPRDGKYLRQGRLVIRKDGREYDASGVRVE